MFKNKKIAFKLTMILLPLTALLIVLTIFMGIRQMQILHEAEATFTNKIAAVESVLLNGDRDFYQCDTLSKTLRFEKDEISSDDYDLAKSDYTENEKQVDEIVPMLREKFATDEYLYKTYKI